MKMGSTEYDTVCKCDNPNIGRIGWTQSRYGRARTPIYHCYNCHKIFKSNANKWKLLAKKE